MQAETGGNRGMGSAGLTEHLPLAGSQGMGKVCPQGDCHFLPTFLSPDWRAQIGALKRECVSNERTKVGMLFKVESLQYSDSLREQGAFVVGPEWERLVRLGTLSQGRHLVSTLLDGKVST